MFAPIQGFEHLFALADVAAPWPQQPAEAPQPTGEPGNRPGFMPQAPPTLTQNPRDTADNKTNNSNIDINNTSSVVGRSVQEAAQPEETAHT